MNSNKNRRPTKSKRNSRYAKSGIGRAQQKKKLGAPRKKPEVKKSVSNVRFYLVSGALFIIAGLLMGYQPLLQYWQERDKQIVSAPPQTRDAAVETDTKAVDPIQGKPARIEIPSLAIDIPVADGIYNPVTKEWTLSKDKAHYALMTTMPNNRAGNTFIYGHNRREVFSRLSKLAIGQTVTVYTDNNHAFTYRFRSAYETDPNDDSLFSYQGPPILTLQTCSGLWYQNRYLLTLDLVEVI